MITNENNPIIYQGLVFFVILLFHVFGEKKSNYLFGVQFLCDFTFQLIDQIINMYNTCSCHRPVRCYHFEFSNSTK